MIRKGNSQTKFAGFSETGVLTDFKIVTIVNDFKNDKSYVVYTEDMDIDENSKSLYAAEFIPDESDFEGGTRLYPIENPDTWNLITTVVKDLAEQEGNMQEGCTHDCHSCSGCE